MKNFHDIMTLDVGQRNWHCGGVYVAHGVIPEAYLDNVENTYFLEKMLHTPLHGVNFFVPCPESRYRDNFSQRRKNFTLSENIYPIKKFLNIITLDKGQGNLCCGGVCVSHWVIPENVEKSYFFVKNTTHTPPGHKFLLPLSRVTMLWKCFMTS